MNRPPTRLTSPTEGGVLGRPTHCRPMILGRLILMTSPTRGRGREGCWGSPAEIHKPDEWRGCGRGHPLPARSPGTARFFCSFSFPKKRRTAHQSVRHYWQACPPSGPTGTTPYPSSASNTPAGIRSLEPRIRRARFMATTSRSLYVANRIRPLRMWLMVFRSGRLPPGVPAMWHAISGPEKLYTRIRHSNTSRCFSSVNPPSLLTIVLYFSILKHKQRRGLMPVPEPVESNQPLLPGPRRQARPGSDLH